jgi:prepilin-type N-terminal cleavage/methylation domain-containing protein
MITIRQRYARARPGMTLMELVIGIAITGLMAAAGAGAFGSIIDHRRVIQEASANTERTAALREMVRSWITAGEIRITAGGLGRANTGQRSIATQAASRAGASIANVTAAQGIGDEINFTTQALNPSMTSTRIRLYVDGDANTPEKGLTIEYQPNLQQSLVRKMLDSTIDTLRVEFLDARSGKWFAAAEASTIQARAIRMSMASSHPERHSRILGIPMIFTDGLTFSNSNAAR